MSNTIFSKNLRKLREDKRISQKSAAASLGISQALLSHYEKGIRECGLDFLTRTAKFYQVSTDFLLGISDSGLNSNHDTPYYPISKNKTKSKIKDDELQKNGKESNIYAALYKNLLTNAISYIFDNMKDSECKEVSVLSGKYISMSVYCLYTLLREGVNDIKLFENYNFENPYLNIIINGVDIKI